MMTADELNGYIMHYLEEDKTHTAIMLTGEWGSGKTYYVENVLVPFLQREKKNRIPFLKKGKRIGALLFRYMVLKIFQI